MVAAAFEVLCVVFVNIPPGIVFDEKYYVPLAANLSAGVYNPFILAQSPLGTEFISTGISWFGNNPLGWRSASIVMGALGIFFLYFISLQMFKRRDLAVVSACTMAFTTLYFSFSSLGVLDIFVLTPFLIGMFVFLYPSKRPRINYLIAGVFIGISVAVKFNFLPLIPFLWLAYKKRWISTAMLTMSAILSFVVALTIGEFVWALGNISHMVDPMTRFIAIFRVQTGYFFPVGSESLKPIAPEFWFFTGQSYKWPLGTILGQPYLACVEIPTLTLGLFAILYVAYKRQWLLTLWTSIAYLPFILMSIVLTRPMYYYYVLPLLPVVALTNVYLTKSIHPRLPYIYLAIALAYFVIVQLPILALLGL